MQVTRQRRCENKVRLSYCDEQARASSASANRLPVVHLLAPCPPAPPVFSTCHQYSVPFTSNTLLTLGDGRTNACID